MWGVAAFLLFSTLEVLAVFVFMLSLFRINALPYIGQSLIIVMLMGLQSLFLREELNLGYVATVINLMCYVLLLTTVIKIPLIWSAIISCSGFFLYGVIQGILYNVIGGQLLQLITSVLFLVLSFILFIFGFGFTKDFDKFRIKGEKILIVVVIIVSFVLTALTMVQHELWINILFFAVASSFFLYFAIRKEREDD